MTLDSTDTQDHHRNSRNRNPGIIQFWNELDNINQQAIDCAIHLGQTCSFCKRRIEGGISGLKTLLLLCEQHGREWQSVSNNWDNTRGCKICGTTYHLSASIEADCQIKYLYQKYKKE